MAVVWVLQTAGVTAVKWAVRWVDYLAVSMDMIKAVTLVDLTDATKVAPTAAKKAVKSADPKAVSTVAHLADAWVD